MNMDRKSFVKKKFTFACTLCQFSSTRRHKLQVHEVNVHGKNINQFDCCGVRFANAAKLQHHMETCHPFRFKCNICGRGFHLVSSFRRHEALHSRVRLFKCQFCDYATTQRNNLDRHLKNHYQEEENVGEIDTHSSKMSKGNWFTCKMCSYRTRGKAILQRHTTTMHKSIIGNGKDFGSHFSRKTAPRQNAASCNPQKNKYASCDWVLDSQQHLHPQDAHADLKKLFHCSSCSFRTKYSFNLEKHKKRMHESSTKLLRCCNVSFDEKMAFRRHKACRHAKRQCEDATLDKRNLKSHVKERENKSSTEESIQHLSSSERNVFDSDDTFPEVKFPQADPILLSRTSRCTVATQQEIVFSTITGQNISSSNSRDGEKSEESSDEEIYETTLIQGKPSRHPKGPNEFLQTIPHKLQKHELSHPDFKEYSCSHCDYASSWQGYIKHIMMHIRGENRHLARTYRSPSRRNDNVDLESISSSPKDSHCQSLLLLSTRMMFNSIRDEARQLRLLIPMAMSSSKLLPLLHRLLEMSSSIMKIIRGAMEIETRIQAIECFEFVWDITKIAIVQWEDLECPMDLIASLNAVRYAYILLPVFLDLKKEEHLEMTDRTLVLIVNTVKNCEFPSLTH